MNKDSPAFPVVAVNNVYSHGMLLRDWFAGMALQGLLASEPVLPSFMAFETTVADNFAREAYTMADAMLKARE